MQSIKCSHCGFVCWGGAESCKSCGAALALNIAAPQARGNYMVQRDLKKGLAIFSLVLGVMNLFGFGVLVVFAVLGTVLALVARNRATRDPYVYGGKELATAGLITNVISLVLIVPIGIIAAIAIPNLLAARRAANEGATISALRSIHAAEATYQATVGAGNFGTLEQLAAHDLLSPQIASGVKNGYRFRIEVTTGLDNEPGFAVVSVPLSYPNTGRRSFFLDESGVIRAADNKGNEATKEDRALANAGELEYTFERPARRSGYDPAY